MTASEKTLETSPPPTPATPETNCKQMLRAAITGQDALDTLKYKQQLVEIAVGILSDYHLPHQTRVERALLVLDIFGPEFTKTYEDYYQQLESFRR